MPDEGPGADQPEHEIDELAKGLVGLPIKLWGWRVDSSGFHRKGSLSRRERHVSWEEVTAVYREDIGLVVEGSRPGRSPGKLLEAHGRLAALGAVVAAWNEYAERRIERDGHLKGQWSAAQLRLRSIPIAGGVTLVGLAILVLLMPPRPRAHWTADRGRVVKQPTRLRIVTYWLAVSTFGMGGIGLCVLGIFHLRRAWSRGCRWARWELSSEGLAFWLGGEKRTLKPAPGDTLTPSEASIGGERVPLRHMAYPLVSQVLLAMGKRRGAVLRRSRSFWLVPGFMWGTALSGGAILLMGLDQWPEHVAGLVIVAGGVVAEIVSAAKAPAKLLFHGRAMFERLGW